MEPHHDNHYDNHQQTHANHAVANHAVANHVVHHAQPVVHQHVPTITVHHYHHHTTSHNSIEPIYSKYDDEGSYDHLVEPYLNQEHYSSSYGGHGLSHSLGTVSSLGHISSSILGGSISGNVGNILSGQVGGSIG